MNQEYAQIVEWQAALSKVRNEMSTRAAVSLQDQIDALGYVLSDLNDLLDEIESAS